MNVKRIYVTKLKKTTHCEHHTAEDSLFYYLWLGLPLARRLCKRTRDFSSIYF